MSDYNKYIFVVLWLQSSHKRVLFSYIIALLEIRQTILNICSSGLKPAIWKKLNSYSGDHIWVRNKSGNLYMNMIEVSIIFKQMIMLINYLLVKFGGYYETFYMNRIQYDTKISHPRVSSVNETYTFCFNITVYRL